jgi:hypothetical protein
MEIGTDGILKGSGIAARVQGQNVVSEQETLEVFQSVVALMYIFEKF